MTKALHQQIEMDTMLDIVAARLPSRMPARILEIGSFAGASLLAMMKRFRGTFIVSVDMPCRTSDPRHHEVMESRGQWFGWSVDFDCVLTAIEGDSHDPAIIAEAGGLGPYDFIFVDGDHSAEGVMQDHLHFWPMLRDGGIMAFHDVAGPRTPEVAQFWTNLTGAKVLIKQDGESAGIGILFKQVR